MFRAKCVRCAWMFDVIALPNPVDVVVGAMRAGCCPMCGNDKGNLTCDPRMLTAEEGAHLANLPSPRGAF